MDDPSVHLSLTTKLQWCVTTRLIVEGARTKLGTAKPDGAKIDIKTFLWTYEVKTTSYELATIPSAK